MASDILVIAGTDSSGGAGLTRDTATAADLGVGVRPVVTAVTVQTNLSLSAVHPVPTCIIAAQIKAACKHPVPAAIKIGMIGTAEAAEAIALELPENLPIVLDPVLKSSSGGHLMPLAAITPILARHDVLLTPNLDECTALTGEAPFERSGDLTAQAQILCARGASAVLVKGGHGSGQKCIDQLFHPDGSQISFSAPRLPVSKRGTGCTLATAIACHLAQGLPLTEACSTAKSYLTEWLLR